VEITLHNLKISFKLFMAFKVYLICKLRHGLDDAEKKRRTLKMIHGRGSHQLLKINKQLPKIVNWMPETQTDGGSTAHSAGHNVLNSS
jgi:hypothetical protein